MMNQNSKEFEDALENFINAITTNWERINHVKWRLQMAALMRASFYQADPKEITRSAWHVIQTITSGFPPSQGEIIAVAGQSIKQEIRRASNSDCEKCNNGVRNVVFWLVEPHTDRHVKHTAGCSCDCSKGVNLKKKLRMENISIFVAKIQNHPRLFNDRVWFQTQKDERPPLEIESYQNTNLRDFVPKRHGSDEMRRKYQEFLLSKAK